MAKPCVFPKIGNLLNRPDWRYYAVQQQLPKLDEFKREQGKKISDEGYTEVGRAGYLKRFVNSDVKKPLWTDNLRLTDEGDDIFDSLTLEEKEVFLKTQRKRLRDQKIQYREFRKHKDLPVGNWIWRVKDLRMIQDEYLRRLVSYMTGHTFDLDMSWALQFKDSKSNSETFDLIGKYMFLGVPDERIAKETNFSVQKITMVRHLFFDFSGKPKNRIHAAAYIRQQYQNEIFTREDFEFYKLIDEIGEVGIKLKNNPHLIDEAEGRIVKKYFSVSVIENLGNFKDARRTMKDAQAFHNMACSMQSSATIEKNLEMLNARIDNIQANTEKLRNTTAVNNSGSMPQDEKSLSLIEQMYKESLRNSDFVTYKSLDKLD